MLESETRIDTVDREAREAKRRYALDKAIETEPQVDGVDKD